MGIWIRCEECGGSGRATFEFWPSRTAIEPAEETRECPECAGNGGWELPLVCPVLVDDGQPNSRYWALRGYTREGERALEHVLPPGWTVDCGRAWLETEGRSDLLEMGQTLSRIYQMGVRRASERPVAPAAVKGVV